MCFNITIKVDHVYQLRLIIMHYNIAETAFKAKFQVVLQTNSRISDVLRYNIVLTFSMN